jgi:hypothetical protein
MSYEFDPDWPDSVPADEEAASLAGLALAPCVARQAEPIKAAHLAARMAESSVCTTSKVTKWRRGETSPQGGGHRAK